MVDELFPFLTVLILFCTGIVVVVDELVEVSDVVVLVMLEVVTVVTVVDVVRVELEVVDVDVVDVAVREVVVEDVEVREVSVTVVDVAVLVIHLLSSIKWLMPASILHEPGQTPSLIACFLVPASITTRV